MEDNSTRILSTDFESMTVKQLVDENEITLLVITDVSETPVTASEDIVVYLKPSTN